MCKTDVINKKSFFPRNFKVLGVQEERREDEGKGEERRRMEEERGSCVLDISDGQWASNLPSGSVMILGCHLCSSIMVKFRSRRCFTKVRF